MTALPELATMSALNIFGPRTSKKRILAAQAEFERIRKKCGRLTRKLVVEETIKLGKRSPIWWKFGGFDVKSAAYAHWLTCAGELIREVKLHVVRSPDAGVSKRIFRAWVYSKEHHSYNPMVMSLTDEQLRHNLLNDLVADIELLQRKYATLTWAAKYLSTVKQKLLRRGR